ncbi:MAG: hypothetical protein FJ146_05405 [Deltaproteobacteria bacterium]|nr:hypothetical protein [Deltaproteobacteria bacterium]
MRWINDLARLLMFLCISSFAFTSPVAAADVERLNEARMIIQRSILHVDAVIGRVYGGTSHRCDQITEYSQCIRQGCLWTEGFCNYGQQSFEMANDGADVNENDYAAAFVLTLIKFKLRVSDANLSEATNAAIAGDFNRSQNLTRSACEFLAAARFKAEAGKLTLLIPGPQTLTVQDFDVIVRDASEAQALIGC